MSSARRVVQAAVSVLVFAVLAGVTVVVLLSTDAAVAQVPTTLPTSAPTTEAPPPTSSPSTTSKPTTTQRPTQTTKAPEPEESDDDTTATPDPGGPTSARPPATGAGARDQGDVPPPDPNLPDAVQLGEEDALITSSASGRLPAIFPWLGLIGTFVFVALLAAQWALTNPARRGSRTL